MSGYVNKIIMYYACIVVFLHYLLLLSYNLEAGLFAACAAQVDPW
jgi:hypothetical protein